MYYAKSTNGFYDIAIHGDNIPEDAVEITQEKYVSLLEGQSSGKIISTDQKGRPILQELTPPSDGILSALARAERDRLFREIYDPGIQMCLRIQRIGTASQKAYAEEKLAELDEYAVALQKIPEQAGFPETIEWPEPPSR